MGKVILYGKEFAFEDASYGVIKDFHRGRPRFADYNIRHLEEFAKHNGRVVITHIVKVNYETIDFCLRRPDEFRFSDDEAESLKRTHKLLHKIYSELENTLG